MMKINKNTFPVVVRNVNKTFDRVSVLKNVSLRLNRGEILGLLGPNGSGKTTLLKIIMGLLPPDSGEVRVLGKNPVLNPNIRYKIGYVPEEVILYDALTVREFLYFMARMRKMDPRRYIEKVKILITLFEMEDRIDCLIGSLSKGDRQKIAVISAVMHNPPILILDEPLLGLDPIAAKIFKELLFEIKFRGGTVLLSTHILELAELLCDRICILHRGSIVAEGSVNDLKKIGKKKQFEDIFLEVVKKDKELLELVRVLREEF